MPKEQKKTKAKSKKATTINMNSKRKLSRLGKKIKKGQFGKAVEYLTRTQALRKLDISLKDFRRLCILKGVYPRDPNTKSSRNGKTYYHYKDMTFLKHEPLLQKFQDLKIFLRKFKRLVNRKEHDSALDLHKRMPKYKLDNLIKERYPRFQDALGDLDDALSLIHLYAHLPSNEFIAEEQTSLCQRLCKEFQEYVVRTRALRKAFLSVKGIYYQAKIQGQNITWVVPYQFTQHVPEQVDLRVMSTFVEFYIVLLKFVNFKLYHSIGIHYPPQLKPEAEAAGEYLTSLELKPLSDSNFTRTDNGNQSCIDDDKAKQDHDVMADLEEEIESYEKNDKVSIQQAISEKRIKSLKQKLSSISNDQDDEEGRNMQSNDAEDENGIDEFDDIHSKALSEAEKEEKRIKELFNDLVFFLGREVPKPSLEFVLRAFGATVCWNGPGSALNESDGAITHQIADRPNMEKTHSSRDYVVPQWVYDSINHGFLIPTDEYFPGKTTPPHLSPFVKDEDESYIPERRKELQRLAAIALGRPLHDSISQQGPQNESKDGNEEDDEEQFMKELEAENKGMMFSKVKNLENNRWYGSDEGKEENSEDEEEQDDEDEEDDDDEEDEEEGEEEEDNEGEEEDNEGEEDDDEEEDDDDDEEEDIEEKDSSDFSDSSDSEEPEPTIQLPPTPSAAPFATSTKLDTKKRERMTFQDEDEKDAKEMAKMLMSNKKRKIYEELKKTDREKQEKAQKLEARRQSLEKNKSVFKRKPKK